MRYWGLSQGFINEKQALYQQALSPAHSSLHHPFSLINKAHSEPTLRSFCYGLGMLRHPKAQFPKWYWEWMKLGRGLVQKEVVRSLASSCSDETDVILVGSLLSLVEVRTLQITSESLLNSCSPLCNTWLLCNISTGPHRGPVHSSTMLFSLQNCELNKHTFIIKCPASGVSL